MAGQVLATEGAILKAVQTTTDARNDLTRELATLAGQLEAIGGNWQGAGATAFRNLMQVWNDNSTRVVRALEVFEQNLTASHKQHEATEDEQQSAFAAIAQRLG